MYKDRLILYLPLLIYRDKKIHKIFLIILSVQFNSVVYVYIFVKQISRNFPSCRAKILSSTPLSSFPLALVTTILLFISMNSTTLDSSHK